VAAVADRWEDKFTVEGYARNLDRVYGELVQLDSKRRRKSGFNLFDLFILLIDAAAVVLIIWLVGGRKSVAVEG
jgi:hypothetical protein